MQVIEDSNQVDAERRSLRAKLRNIQRKIKGTEDGEAIENPSSGLSEQFRKNELLKKCGTIVRVC